MSSPPTPFFVFVDMDNTLVNTQIAEYRGTRSKYFDYQSPKFDTSLRPGSLAFLEQLKQTIPNVQVCILTSGSESLQKEVLNALKLTPWIDRVYGKEALQSGESLNLELGSFVLIDDLATNSNVVQKGTFLGVSFPADYRSGMASPEEAKALISPWFVQVERFFVSRVDENDPERKIIPGLDSYLPDVLNCLNTEHAFDDPPSLALDLDLA